MAATAAARTLRHASAAPCAATRCSSAMLMLISSPNSCPCFCFSQPWLHNTTPMAAVTVLVRGRGRRPTMVRCSSSATAAVVPTQQSVKSLCEKSGTMSLLEKLRQRFIKDSAKESQSQSASKSKSKQKQATQIQEQAQAQDFAELGLSGEVLSALEELKIRVPTEVQSLGIRAILKGHSIVLASHTGSGKTLAYMLPLIQMLRKDESETGKQMKPKRPRAVVLCPTRELCEQVFHVAKSLSHHARFRSTMISGGVRMKPQEDALNCPLEMVVGTPGRLLQHINEGNMFYGDIKYVVIDEADTMFDHGFGPDLRKFLNPLRNKASKPGDGGFQSILVTATITKAVQKLLDEEFQGITHVHTSTLHKRISTAWHDFIKLSGSENKLEALLQVLEPSLAKGNKVMVFCNTLDSSRAVDHFLNENQLLTVNYHGGVPAEKRVENLNKFKSDDPDCPTLVCTDLAARGLDLAVDHVVMFDFPLNPIDYLHRTGRTARMGAKGKVTSLVTKKDMILASKIEDAVRKNESLESLTAYKDKPRAKKQNENRNSKDPVTSRVKNSGKPLQNMKSGKVTSSKVGAKPKASLLKKSKTASTHKSKTTVRISNTKQNNATKKSKMNSSARPGLSDKTKQAAKVWKSEKPLTTRLSVIGFKGRKTS